MLGDASVSSSRGVGSLSHPLTKACSLGRFMAPDTSEVWMSVYGSGVKNWRGEVRTVP